MKTNQLSTLVILCLPSLLLGRPIHEVGQFPVDLTKDAVDIPRKEGPSAIDNLAPGAKCTTDAKNSPITSPTKETPPKLPPSKSKQVSKQVDFNQTPHPDHATPLPHDHDHDHDPSAKPTNNQPPPEKLVDVSLPLDSDHSIGYSQGSYQPVDHGDTSSPHVISTRNPFADDEHDLKSQELSSHTESHTIVPPLKGDDEHDLKSQELSSHTESHTIVPPLKGGIPEGSDPVEGKGVGSKWKKTPKKAWKKFSTSIAEWYRTSDSILARFLRRMSNYFSLSKLQRARKAEVTAKSKPEAEVVKVVAENEIPAKDSLNA